MAPIPQINITPGVQARTPSLDSVTRAFEAQLTAEQENKPVTSFIEGVQQGQTIVTNQQAIQLNELERERRELANRIERTQQAQDTQFTKAINTGNLNEATNALLSTPTNVLLRNKDAALAMSNFIIENGNDVQKEMIEDKVLSRLDADALVRKRKNEEFLNRREQEIKLQKDKEIEVAKARARGELLTPEQQAIQQEKDQIALETARANRDIKQATLAEKRQGTRQAQTDLELETEKQGRLANFLERNGEVRRAQELKIAMNKAKRLAKERNLDELEMQKQVTKNFLKLLDADERAEVEAAVSSDALASTPIPRGPGQAALLGQRAAQASQPADVSLDQIEQEMISRGKTTKEGLDLLINQEMARLKAAARAQNIQLKRSDAEFRQEIRKRILLELKRRNP